MIVGEMKQLLSEAESAGGNPDAIQRIKYDLDRLAPPQASLADIEIAAEAESQVVKKIIQMGITFELPPAVIDRVQLRSLFCSHLIGQIRVANANGVFPDSFSFQLSTPKDQLTLNVLRGNFSAINVQEHTFDENLSFIVAPDASDIGKFRIVVYSEKDFALLERAKTSQQAI